MKTAICDICKRTQADLANNMAYIRHFKMTTWHRWSCVRTEEIDFDICDRCLEQISKQMKGEHHD